MDSSIVPYLFGITFAFAIAFGIWQYIRARKARKEHHTSAMARHENDPPTAEPLNRT